MITIRQGDLFGPFLADPRPRVLAHVVNAAGIMGRGFAAQVLHYYPEAGTPYFTNTPALGEVQLVQYQNVTIAHMCAMRDVYNARRNPQPLDMDALRSCLAYLGGFIQATNLPLYLPKIGAYLARGDWNIIYPEIELYLGEGEVYLYEL